MIKITVNGQEKEVADDITVRQLIVELELGKAAVAVEVNRELIPKKIHESTVLTDGDTVELVTLVGGG
ncbi:MAG: thiamine biosynthesis protein ThiS [Phycisphaeraceae bacterium]|nr:thiamine biosynthesis protein ThiS [Phycisphaeraceae bacterium]